ncbi:hypothetical protein MGA3_06300 [Bacillus methanolicus MGA3]|nr:hypothetical protein MGA3_06300 [Bacillus methanolicus MGA3]
MKLPLFMASILAFLLVTACTNNMNNDTARRNNTGPKNVGYNNNVDIMDQNRDIIRNDRDGNNAPRMVVADRAAERIAAMPEVDQANVIVTDNNAYVAAKLNDDHNRANTKNGNYGLTADIERKISDHVKAVDRDIDNVYVSVNPDFYDRMRNYADDIRAGKPIQGFFEEFTEAVRRVFPNQR